jgi:hypothetical protein
MLIPLSELISKRPPTRQENPQISDDSSEQPPFPAQDHAAPIVAPERTGRGQADSPNFSPRWDTSQAAGTLWLYKVRKSATLVSSSAFRCHSEEPQTVLSEIPAHFSASRPTIRSFPVNNALVSPRPPQNPRIFCKKPARKHDILSRSPLFSYTSPEVPSLLTSLRVSSPFPDINQHIK